MNLAISLTKAKVLIISWCFILAFVSRLLFLNTNVFYVDGDEALVGLMGIDLLSGNIPTYFYGQTYGFSLIEAAAIAIGIIFFGTTELAIKVPMLILWCMSVSLLALTVFRMSKGNLLLTLLWLTMAITAPGWFIWSMEARGGYLTSFLASSFSIYLLFHQTIAKSIKFWIIQGLLLLLIFESHALWFIPTLLLNLYILFKNQSKKRIIRFLLALSTPILFGVLLLSYYKSFLFVVWETPTPSLLGLFIDPKLLERMVLSLLNGDYYLSYTWDSSYTLHAVLFLLLFSMCLPITLKDVIQSRSIHLTLILLIVSLVCLSGYVFNHYSPRYILPFYFFTALWISFSITKISSLKIKWAFYILVGLTIVSSLIYLPNYRFYSAVDMNILNNNNPLRKSCRKHNIPINDNESINKLIGVLMHSNIECVVVTNEIIAPKINYFSNYQLLAAGKLGKSRTPAVEYEIAKKYEHAPEKIAIVGYNWHNKVKSLPLIDEKLFYYPKARLKSLIDLSLKPLSPEKVIQYHYSQGKKILPKSAL